MLISFMFVRRMSTEVKGQGISTLNSALGKSIVTPANNAFNALKSPTREALFDEDTISAFATMPTKASTKVISVFSL